MKYTLIIILVSLTVGLFLTGCAELENNIAPAGNVEVHKDGFLNPNSTNFHGDYIKNHNWNLKECQQCHASDYSGGLTKSSCNTCHTNPGGPEACNTCHGNFADPTRIAPPKDISGNTATTNKSVGAHEKHLYANSLSVVQCQDCHTVPASVFAAGHLDSNLPAEVNMNNVAVANIASNAMYDFNSATCGNTYCHGNFEFTRATAAPQDTFIFVSDKMVGNNNTVSWTQVDGTQAQCGSCHGSSESIAPVGHLPVPINACFNCHGDVVDAEGNIIDKTKHANGIINARTN